MAHIIKTKKSDKTGHSKTRQDLQFAAKKQDLELRDIHGRLLPQVVKQLMWTISHYRLKAIMQAKAHMPITFGLKTIEITPRLHVQFESWWKSCAKEEEAEATGALITFMDVEIVRGISSQKDDLKPVFYQRQLAKA